MNSSNNKRSFIMCKSPSVVFLNLICRDLEPTFHLTYQSKKVRMLHTNYTLLALCDYFLSHFLIIFLEFVRLFLFVTLYNDFFQKCPKRAGEAFLSHYVIKTGIITNLNSIQISTVFSFQKCQERRRLYFTFGFFSTLFDQVLSKKSKSPVQYEI